ncbi:MAG: hypothetical protein QY332_16010 [Anaerolineales bacterium]|nr:MAG: hypothetical protein QY332_16010 [Anaerolineales bacterium]
MKTSPDGREQVLRFFGYRGDFQRGRHVDETTQSHDRQDHRTGNLEADLSLETAEARLAKLLLDSAEGDVIEHRRWTNQTGMVSYLGEVSDVLSHVIRELFTKP